MPLFRFIGYLLISDPIFSSPDRNFLFLELTEGAFETVLCNATVSISRKLKWENRLVSGMAIKYIENRSLTDADTAIMCQGYDAGSILSIQSPVFTFQSAQHDDAYLSVQKTLLVICGADNESAGVYTCRAESADARHVHVLVTSAYNPGSFRNPRTPLLWTMGSLLLVAAVVSISGCLLYAVRCCRKNPTTLRALRVLKDSSIPPQVSPKTSLNEQEKTNK